MYPPSASIVNISADENLVIQASTIIAEQMVKDSGRKKDPEVAPVNSPLLSDFWSLSAEKSSTFNFEPFRHSEEMAGNKEDREKTEQG